jgi:hypothetical protein
MRYILLLLLPITLLAQTKFDPEYTIKKAQKAQVKALQSQKWRKELTSTPYFTSPRKDQGVLEFYDQVILAEKTRKRLFELIISNQESIIPLYKDIIAYCKRYDFKFDKVLKEKIDNTVAFSKEAIMYLIMDNSNMRQSILICRENIENAQKAKAKASQKSF